MVTAAPILDSNGVVRGAIQTIQEAGSPPGQGGTDRAGHMRPRPKMPIASAVFRVDAQGKITFWNESCAREFGYPSSEMVGKSVFTFVSKQYRPLFKETLIGALKGESFTDRAFKYYGQEGKPVYVLAKVYPVEHCGGRRQGVRRGEHECYGTPIEDQEAGALCRGEQGKTEERHRGLRPAQEEHRDLHPEEGGTATIETAHGVSRGRQTAQGKKSSSGWLFRVP